MADGKMSDILSPTAKALSRAAVIAHNERDEGCVRAILSALWNLASHSERNKRAICDEPGFLALLTSLLSNDARMTAVVESASGILKYVSQYLSTNSSHLTARPEIAAHLVQLLSSASFTIVANTLGALANLIAKDPHLQSLVRHDAMAMNQLNVLRNSAREDIRAAVKAVLNHLNQPVGYTRYADMSSSLGCETMCSPRDSRLLALRGVRMSPGAISGFGAAPSFDHRSSSLPRHFTRGGFTASSHASPHHAFPSVRGPISSGPALGFAPPPGQYSGPLLDEDVSVQPPVVPDEITGDPNLEDSVRCTRSVSAASLGSELPNTSVGWQSNLDTAVNSNRMSPVSPSDLPDSPTQCAKMVVSKGDTSTPLSVKVRDASGAASSSEPQSGLTASDTPTAIVDDQPTPTFPAFAIPAQLPPMKIASSEESQPGKFLKLFMWQRITDDRLLADMIEAAQPSPRKGRHGSDAHHSPNDRLLSACIDAAMPQPSPSFKSSSKNEQGGHGCSPVTHRVRPSQQTAGHPVNVEDIEEQFERLALEQARTQFSLSRESSESWSDGDEGLEQLDTTLPVDCYIEEDITIDCSAIRFPSRSGAHSSSTTTGCSSSVQSTPVKTNPRGSKPTVAHKTRLPKPTSRTSSLQRPSRGSSSLTPRKEAKSAIVPPYNYRKPETNTSGLEKPDMQKQPGNANNSSQMLVTTV
ncbi:hypothetical protein ANCCAN_15381 [Ancylostoma caninum]|uniref:Armadillo/beta-catenin-like repeat protein n=1 Tax=Ancylostoma caninum TaxID=29170 RepID=A0A368G6T9_ANCCA|nr:hypothetical protein ANCCAN_15381 [Ancylostoma caninum]